MPLTQAQAQYIFDNTVGCRYGGTAVGAAYGFMDIVGFGPAGGALNPPVGVVLSWLQNPQDPEFEPRWTERLWNTCGVIVGLSAAGTVLLISEAPPTAERYLFPCEPLALGDGYSFRKCNLLQPRAEILATIAYGVGVAALEQEDPRPSASMADVTGEQVQELYDNIMAALSNLAP